ncbi:MAG: hypothetical protein H6707_13305 [Deltaproteobacteria bacterium]|nr:hypothetical protein [Deltaproteobacteria bacterium]
MMMIPRRYILVLAIVLGLGTGRASAEGPSGKVVDALYRQVISKYGLSARHRQRIERGLRVNTARSRRLVFDALTTIEKAAKARGSFALYPRQDYLDPSRSQLRPPEKQRAVKPPKTPQPTGVFEPRAWQKLLPNQRARALGLVLEDGKLSRPSVTAELNPVKLDDGQASSQLPQQGAHRRIVFRKAPRYVGGLVSFLFGGSEARQLNQSLDKVLSPTAEGSYDLFAEKVTLLYPNLPITPRGKKLYDTALAEQLKKAAFVFFESYQFTDNRAFDQIEAVANSGVPVYGIVGEVEAGTQVAERWATGKSKVNFVQARIDAQGKGREYRIDHNKKVFIVRKDGSVVVFGGGFNKNALSTQNFDLGHMIEGGTVGLGVINDLTRDFLRGGGKIDTKELAPLKRALAKMINARKPRKAIRVELAVTSSSRVRSGRRLKLGELKSELRNDDNLYVCATTILDALQIGVGRSEQQARQVRREIKLAAGRGKRIVVTIPPELASAERLQLSALTTDLGAVGVEVVEAGTIYVDNSTENVSHRLVAEAARRGESIWQGAFANSDGNFTRALLEASTVLKQLAPYQQVHVFSADLEIDQRKINAASNARLLMSRDFHGELIGISNIPGPRDEHGRPRKFHVKALVGYRRADRYGPASGWYSLKSNNDSVHGFRVNEESSITVYSPELAREVIHFLKRAKVAYGKPLVQALRLTRTPLEERQSLTRRIMQPTTKLKDTLFVVMDFETDGLSMMSDGRPIELAAAAYSLDAKTQRLVPLRTRSMAGEFSRLVHPGRDLYGREKRLSRIAADITKISDELVGYESSLVDVFNDFNGWIRTLEMQTGKTVMFVGHNFATFDRRQYNDFSRVRGIRGNPYIDGDVADTLSALKKPLFERVKQSGLKRPLSLGSSTKWLGIKWDAQDQAHRALGDVHANAKLFETQLRIIAGQEAGLLNKLKQRRQPTDLGNAEWGEVREYFLPNTELRRERKRRRSEQVVQQSAQQTAQQTVQQRGEAQP